MRRAKFSTFFPMKTSRETCKLLRSGYEMIFNLLPARNKGLLALSHGDIYSVPICLYVHLISIYKNELIRFFLSLSIWKLNKLLIGSCHENVPGRKAVSSNLWSTDRMTVLDRIEIVPILVHYRSVNVESKFESFHLNQKMNEKFLPCFLKLEQKFLVQMKTFKFSFDIYWPSSTILQQFTHNETQWPTDARQCCFALWDVSCRQSWHFSTPSQ